VFKPHGARELQARCALDDAAGPRTVPFSIPSVWISRTAFWCSPRMVRKMESRMKMAVKRYARKRKELP
jgi:hypothetical protein